MGQLFLILMVYGSSLVQKESSAWWFINQLNPSANHSYIELHRTLATAFIVPASSSLNFIALPTHNFGQSTSTYEVSNESYLPELIAVSQNEARSPSQRND